MDFSFEVPPIRMRADFCLMGSIGLYALILRATLLRALSCLLFNRADSVGHYDPGADALHRLLWCYSATTAPAKLVEYIFVRSSILRLSCPDTMYPGALMSPTSQEEGDFGEEKNRSLNIP